MSTVQSEIYSGQSTVVEAVSRARLTTVRIVAAYVAVFFGLLPILLWSLAGRLDALLNLPALTGPAWRGAGAFVVLLGWIWMTWSMVLLRVVGGGWPISHLPPVRLVTTGPYRFNRHPIYVGYVAVVGGLALFSGSPGGLLVAGLLAVGIVDYVLGVEGPALQRRFAGSYTRYQPHARRLATTSRLLWTRLRRPVEWLANRPVLCRVGPTVWVTYGLFVALGTVVSTSVALDRLATDGLSTRQLVAYALVVVPAMVLGARLLWFPVAHRQVRQMGAMRAIRTVGLVSWGAYVGFFAGSAVYAATQHVGLLWLLDRTVPTALLCSVVGRIGCLTYGCCFGRVWRNGISWHAPESKVVRQLGADAAHARVPVQLLSAGATLLAVLLACLVSLRPAPSGAVTGATMLLYAMGRFAVDSFRDSTFALRRVGKMNLGHLSSLLVAVVGLVLLYTVRGPAAWPRSMFAFDWTLLGQLLPVVAALTVLAFLVAGYQWRRVGQW